MSSYEYSYSTSMGGATANNGGNSSGEFDLAKAVFSQVDTNADGTIDRGEFQNWISGVGQQTNNTIGHATSNAAYQSVSYGSNGGSYTVDNGPTFNGSSSTFESSAINVDGNAVASTIGNYTNSSTHESTNIGSNFDTTAVNQASSYTAESNASWSQYGADVKGIGLYFDKNPQIIRRAATGGVHTYTQNIKVRFLQPPPIPPPGPLIIKEVRPPQPPPPPPLRIRQQAPQIPQPPPLILRERPPPTPTVQGPQTIIRQLPALPVPPRSVIIERIPAAPARPRDIIIERWLPYCSNTKRKTIVQRAEAAKEYPKPRNIIIQYEPVQVRVVRQFQRLGVVQENPQTYLQRYGTNLLDAQNLVQQARAAGVIEDISAPPVKFIDVSSNSFGNDSSLNVVGAEITGNINEGAAGSTSFSSSTFEKGTINGINTGLNGVIYREGLTSATESGGIYSSSNYESSTAYSGIGGINASSGFNVNDYSSTDSSTGFNVVASVFNAVDKNKDGTIDPQEFKQFYQSGL